VFGGIDKMSDTNDRCAFEHSDYCCPPNEWKNFKCQHQLPIQEGDITYKCGATDDDLFTEEEWEADQMYDKMKGSIDDWEMKGHRRR
jgi:hypothetical protein